jgi:rare lipoprotein A
MDRPEKPCKVTQARSRWFWPVSLVLSLAMAAACWMDSTLTVEADVQLARPASTLPPPAPPKSLLSAPREPDSSAIPRDALRGLATWYGMVLEGHPTASGERFHMEAMTAAHKTLPFGTLVRVINLRTRKSVVVRVNDRGVLPENRVIDLSCAAAEQLDIIRRGVVPVKLEILALGGSPKPQP